MSTHIPKLIVIAEVPSQRLAFGEAVKASGFELLDCVPSERVDAQFLALKPDLWLIDAKDDLDIIERLKNDDKFLLGFTSAPHIADVKAFGKWQRSLKRKLYQVLGEPLVSHADSQVQEAQVQQTQAQGARKKHTEVLKAQAAKAQHQSSSTNDDKTLTQPAVSRSYDGLKTYFKNKSTNSNTITKDDRIDDKIPESAAVQTHGNIQQTKDSSSATYTPEQYFKTLLVLGASFGGPESVKIFLDHLPCDLPIRAVLAQHIDPKAAQALPSILTRNNIWQCRVVNKVEKLQQGVLYILPPSHQISFTPSSLCPTGKPWETHYKPCISDVMLAASQIFARRVLHIIFSGMGDDGSSAANYCVDLGSKIWAQAPQSAICDSQPNASIDTGHVSFIAPPDELAKKVVEYVATM